MGYNTPVLILNDNLGGIRDDPEFGKKLDYAIATMEDGATVRSGFGVAAKVAKTDHADHYQVIAFGGNRMLRLGYVFGPRHNKEFSDDPVYFLRKMAEELGYDLVKKKKGRRKK